MTDSVGSDKTGCYTPIMEDVINALTEAGLRDKAKVIIGGAPVNQEFASQIGADYYGRDAGSTAALLEMVLTERKGE